ncbi:MAG: MBL fold metallo-hydrolase [Clostridiales bacterium]|nr:MBL fold metallo-hydrolase [Clostridiales bacterium]
MKLTILGEYGPYPPADGVCSAYLVSEDGFHLLLECGPGALMRLQREIALYELRAVALSHLHSDHIADMGVLRYALAALRKSGAPVTCPLPVFCPGSPGAEAEFLRNEPAFAVSHIEPGFTVKQGPFTISFYPMEHPVPSYAMSISCRGRRIFYTGDTRMHDRLEPLARGADLFLCEAGCLERNRTPETPHLSVAQAARIGLDAGCPRVILTHLPPNADRAELAAEAAQVHPGAALARALDAYVL